MIVIYNRPSDIEAFERHYFFTHVPLIMKLPGLRKFEVSNGEVTAPYGPSDAHLIATLHFDDMQAIRDAFASDAGKACAADRRRFASETPSTQTFLFEHKIVQ
jgi:uncharacterized protein (TIGR02118 family)